MALSILDLAACASHHRRLESRLAALLAEWADDAEPAVAAMFAAHGHLLAHHADAWAARLPSQPSTSLDTLVAEALADASQERCRFDESVMHSVDTLAVADGTIERLVGVYQLVLPRLLATCMSLRDTVEARVDAPTARVLDLVIDDLTEALPAGTQLLADLRS